MRLNFKRLSDAGFEEFICGLLDSLGFVNISWRKGTPKESSPADSERDIVAYQDRVDIDRAHHLEKWFVDCKHYSRGVPPTALRNLLAWAEAERPDGVLFAVSGFLSNPSKDYLEKYRENNRPPFKIKHWKKPQLERLTRARVARKFFSTGPRIRSVKSILAAEDEFCMKV